MRHLSARFVAVLLFGFLCFTAASVFAQTPLPAGRVADHNHHVWLVYNGDFQLVKRWGVHTEAQWRRANWISDPQQNFVRAGINYHATDNLLLTAGYAFADTHPYGDYPAASAFPEHRLYQQVLLKDNDGWLQLQHRYRLEQRWVRFAGQDIYTYLNRVRYQLRLAAPLVGAKITPRTPYVVASDELFVNFGQNVTNNFFDQNRLYGAFGYVVKKGVSVEAGYMHQLVQQRNGRVFEHNHTMQLGLTLNLDFRRTPVTPAEAAPGASQ
ncbi:DUF2490 domain-containing protein [Hymenobacter busanensis]|uniref:DUF2490 domain-containing protein n=1 Tax=Hymenobacter busanensis TaxID=2607656 RepID=A0A7L5A155_9BACT|nr:DUF2490 domain-containing protein [Hymenobacter busanensis]KAA9338564.1 DUF2490 domain-containing protein [Hymenobacter busanensis]QHJ09007.1 DUF2490 domain-containing protein [Hymenobacter busanensis]